MVNLQSAVFDVPSQIRFFLNQIIDRLAELVFDAMFLCDFAHAKNAFSRIIVHFDFIVAGFNKAIGG